MSSIKICLISVPSYRNFEKERFVHKKNIENLNETYYFDSNHIFLLEIHVTFSERSRFSSFWYLSSPIPSAESSDTIVIAQQSPQLTKDLSAIFMLTC